VKALREFGDRGFGLPATRDQLKEAGYVFEFARKCKRCGRALEFYRTPSKAIAPLEGIFFRGVWLMDSHFKTCPFRDFFKKPAPVSRATTYPTSGNLFEEKSK
jgi:hypothetical protein